MLRHTGVAQQASVYVHSGKACMYQAPNILAASCSTGRSAAPQREMSQEAPYEMLPDNTVACAELGMNKTSLSSLMQCVVTWGVLLIHEQQQAPSDKVHAL
jgi:hypothetical protein